MNYLIVILLSVPIYAQESEALHAMKLGCEKGKSSIGCYHYANLLIRNGKESEASEVFKKACQLGHKPSCDEEKWESLESKRESGPIEPEKNEISDEEPSE